MRRYKTSVGQVCVYHGVSAELALEHFHNQALNMRRVFGEEARCEVQAHKNAPWQRVISCAPMRRAPLGLCPRCGGDGVIEGGAAQCHRCHGRGVC